MTLDFSDEPPCPIYVVVNGELILEVPPDRAWPHVIDYPAWQNYSIIERVAGEPGCEGETFMLKKEEGEPSSAFFARTVKIGPGRRIIWKTFRPKASPGGDGFGFVEFRVDATNGNARFSYNLLYEFAAPSSDADECTQFRKRQHSAVHDLLSRVLPRLKKLAEADGSNP